MKQLLLIGLFFISALSQDVKYAADFIYLDFGAKTLASGNSFFIDEADLSAVHWFPADYSLHSQQLIFSTVTSKFAGLVDQAHVGFSQPLIGGYNIAINWNYSGVTDIPKFENLVLEIDGTPSQKTPSGFFDYSNHVASLTFGRVFDQEIDLGWEYFKFPLRIPVALNVNYLRSTLYEYTANGITLDLSFGLKFNLERFLKVKHLGDLSFYTNIANIAGSDLIWDTVERTIKTNSGDEKVTYTSYEHISNNTIIGWNFTQPSPDKSWKFGLAMQYQSFYNTWSSGVLLQYKSFGEIRLGLDDNLITAGIGGSYQNISVFVAMKPSHDLGRTMNMDLSYAF